MDRALPVLFVLRMLGSMTGPNRPAVPAMDRVENISKLHAARITSRRFVPRALPDFLVIGAQRSGTTTLYEYLTTHESVRPPVRKEVHFFSSHYSRGIGWYRAHFPLAFSKLRAWQTFECTPHYLVHPAVPERVRHDLPEVRLVAVLRDPVKRFLSQYRMNAARGIETRTLGEVLTAERMLDDASHQDRVSPIERRTYSYLARGRYAEQIERWLAHFPREQFHLVDFDDLVYEPRTTLDGIFEFLELATPPVLKSVHSGYRTEGSARIPEADDLREYYRPHDERLSEVVGRSFRWQ